MGERPPVVTMDEQCPYLFCTKPVPHEHRVCEECGSVRYGNFSCPRCRTMSDELGDDR